MSAKREISTLDRSIVHAIAWTGAAMWAAQLFSWASTIYVARLLSPRDYGVFAMASVYMGLVALLSELGVGSVVVVLRDLKGREIAELNSISVIAGILCWVISLITARSVAAFFSSSELPPVIMAMGPMFVISSLKVVPDSLLQQELRFKLLAHLDGLRAFIQAAATAVTVSLGWGYWSLVAGSLIGAAVATLLTLSFRRHTFAWPHLRSLGPALHMSRDLIVMRFAWYVYSNADFVIVGRLLGEAPLGAYRFAWSIAYIPVDKISAMVTRTSQAFFSKVQQEHHLLRRYLLGLTQGLAILTIPASVGLSLLADEFVAVALGPQWESAVLPLRLLAAYVAIRSLVQLIPPLLNVTGDSRFAAANAVVAALALPLGFYVGAAWGVAGVAAAWFVLHPTTVVPLYWRAFHRINLSFKEYFDALCPAIAGTAVLSAAVMLAGHVHPAGWLPVFHMTALVAVGITSYSAYILIFHTETARQLKQIVAMLRSSN